MMPILKTLWISMLLCAPLLATEFTIDQDKRFPIVVEPVPSPPLAPPEGSKSLNFDNHGNFWALAPAEKKGFWNIMVLPAQDQSRWMIEELGGLKAGGWKELLCDHKDHIWLRSEDELYRLYPKSPSWQLISADSAFPQGKITAMCVAPDGNVAVAIHSGSIVFLDRRSPQPRTQIRNVISTRPAPKKVNAMGMDAEGALWLKAGNKTYRSPAREAAWQKHWEVVSLMPSGSHDLSGDVLNNVFYMAWAITADHGYPSVGNFHREMLSFDAKTSIWKKEIDYGLPRGYCGTGVLGKTIWTVGGDALDENKKRYTTTLSQIYDTETGQLSQGPDLPARIPSAICLSAGGRLYALGFSQEKTLQIFSIGEGETQWTHEPHGPLGAGSSYGTELNGILYTIVDHRYLAAFDPKTKTWKTHEAPHSPRSPAIGHYNGEIWIMGGRGKEGGKVTYIYNPKDESWRQGPDLPRHLIWGCAFNINGDLYVAGGAATSPYSFSHRTYRLRSTQEK